MASFAALHDLAGKVAVAAVSPDRSLIAAPGFTAGAVIRADGGVARTA